MAVVDLIDSMLQLTFSEGVDAESGEPILTYKRFNQVKVEANHEQLYNVATAFAGLQEYTLYQVSRRDISDIYES
ncbi:DUF1659 domain-containing protein [Oceanobacillus sp. 1P07AA]|uniref:DUF1659 domain-containing protein n=1 Tax=Oceanobacillus sp. 1P07AA TaxID=3132293 RepID=UPI0039A4947F